LRLRALRPQLKRDPLGGALPPRNFAFATSSFERWVCGAPSAETRGRAAVRRAPPPQVRHARGAPRSPLTPLLPRNNLPRRAGPALRLARGALEHLAMRAV